MTNDEEEARRVRADALRQRIAALKSGESTRETSDDDSKIHGSENNRKRGDEKNLQGESPREFVQRRMRELDRDKGKSDASDA